MLLVIYHGHDEGKMEKESISKLLKELNQKEFNVLKFKFTNQANNPPILYAVEKNSN